MIQLYEKFFMDFKKLFNYGSTKENLPNKLLKNMGIHVEVQINDQTYPNYKYFMRSENFTSHLLLKINEVSKMPINLTEKLNISLKFSSS